MAFRHVTTFFVTITCLGLSAPIAFAQSTVAAAEKHPFTIGDYFKLQRVTELALSSDGGMLAYIVEQLSLEENRAVRTVYVSSTKAGAEPIRIDKIQKARDFAWIPGTSELAYLSSDEGVTQVYSINVRNQKIRQHTRGGDPVVKFRFAPVDNGLAWQTKPEHKPTSPYDRLFNGEEGVIINSENTAAYHFVNPELPYYGSRPANALWLKEKEGPAFPVTTPGQVREFYWSSDASKLSVSYVGDDLPEMVIFNNHTSLGVFELATKKFHVIAQARPKTGTEQATSFLGGEWVPGKDKLFVRRIIQHDLWRHNIEWSVLDFSIENSSEKEKRSWRKIDATLRDSKSAFFPMDENTIFSNMAIHARRSFYQLTPSGFERANMLKDVDGSSSFFQFSVDFEKAAFVNESLSRPREIYIWRKGKGVRKLTNLNEGMEKKILPMAKEVTWASKDGTTVHGWLLEPIGDRPNNSPWPLVTFVHGGPTLPVKDEFGFYFKTYGGIWPYPFEVYALNGMAVFIPNYRGTGTFGDKFANPTRLDGEPIDDIVSGIEHLIAEGVADPDRLAISGHSHGAWLGPLVMTRSRFFRAGSFAESAQNSILMYLLAPRFSNRDVHDIKFGASLYDDPQRYIGISADMHFEGLDTAVLFEAGARSLAIQMMGSLKAALHAGMPTEFVVYPQTGHNVRLPRLQRESAERNLDWFRFWLLDEEDLNPAKAGQYVRWRKMRHEQK